MGRQWVKGASGYSNPELRNGYQNPSPMYATEQDAHRALAYAVADHFGAVMAKVYAKCF